MNIDERSASFMALGIAKAHKEPTVTRLYLWFGSGSLFARLF